MSYLRVSYSWYISFLFLHFGKKDFKGFLHMDNFYTGKHLPVHELLNGVVHPTSRHGFRGIEVDNFRMFVYHCRTEGVSQPFMFGGYYRRFAKHLSKFSFIWVEVGNEVGHISNSTNDVIRAKGRTFIMRGCCTCSWHTYCH
nr:MAG TPA: hypothetical protein [Caudoviricetes sp.]